MKNRRMAQGSSQSSLYQINHSQKIRNNILEIKDLSYGEYAIAILTRC